MAVQIPCPTCGKKVTMTQMLRHVCRKSTLPKCAREDCKAPFVIKTRKTKLHCSRRCQRIMATRRAQAKKHIREV